MVFPIFSFYNEKSCLSFPYALMRHRRFKLLAYKQKVWSSLMKGCMQKNLLNPPSRVQQVFVRKVLQLVCNKYNVVLIQYYLSV